MKTADAIPTPPTIKQAQSLKASGLQIAALKLLVERLDDCRTKCPGIGGDIDASNVRYMVQTREWIPSGVSQALACIKRLSESLDVPAADAIEAIESVAGHTRLADENAALRSSLAVAIAQIPFVSTRGDYFAQGLVAQLQSDLAALNR